MRALTHTRYGGIDTLELGELPLPEPGPGHIRVRVEAAGLNPFDWHMYRGEPWMMRLSEGMRFERRTVGADLAGTVDAIGPGVTEFGVGDRVMGEPGRGALAELAIVRPGGLARIADHVSTEAAAAAPMGATALQALRDGGAVSPGSRVLIYGASGGVGHLAVQIARALGAAHVTAVCSGRNAAMVRAGRRRGRRLRGR